MKYRFSTYLLANTDGNGNIIIFNTLFHNSVCIKKEESSIFFDLRKQIIDTGDYLGPKHNIQQFLDHNKNISTELFNEGDEIRMGLAHSKAIYTYYTIVGTEIPQKLWLTSLNLSDTITIDGQADNLESIYSFFRNIKDYNPNSKIKLQKLSYATKSKMKV